MGLIYRFLQLTTAALLSIGIWQHDWSVIIASVALLLMWRMILREVMEPTR
jgi:hypothetical protein